MAGAAEHEITVDLGGTAALSRDLKRQRGDRSELARAAILALARAGGA